MDARPLVFVAAILVAAHGSAAATPAAEVADLRLVPFPKQIDLRLGEFALGRTLVLEVPPGHGQFLARLVADEIRRAGLPVPTVQILDGAAHRLRFRAATAPWPTFAFRENATPEDYCLSVDPQAVSIAAQGPAGLLYGVQTLCQLIRANRTPQGLPCLAIRDWPSMRWRCFQDDLTRGPSATLDTLRSEVSLGAYFKMNLFTYYMEYQYAFKKHPKIGPPDGSLTPDEMGRLVEFGRPLGVEILGNQQSFGHFGRILQHPEYAGLGENASVLTPVKEETYRLLDDLYSEVCPLLPFGWFNVCCDETWGLGTGPSKELAERIGVGGVYVQHIRRVHDLLAEKYKKRMMMWGDIILKHPEHLDQIPKDTIMLTWGYGAKPSFEDQIIPFARSGYEFFVCPGVSDWSRILPDFSVAMTNIGHFVRDGAKLGALGMLNTEWKDDGETLGGVNWHGYAWGAECAWNASATDPADFNRRIGAVLFGERGDRFGRAIERLAQAHRLPGMLGMNNKRFWQNDFLPERSPAAIEASSKRLLEIVEPAIADLAACRAEATVNAHLPDEFLLGARRMELVARRPLDGLEVTRLYAQARDVPADKAIELLDRAEALVQRNRDAHETLGRDFARLWLAQNKPYALDWTMKRYEATVKWYDELAARLEKARQAAREGKPLPPPEDIGLGQGSHARAVRPQALESLPLDPETPWDVPATQRLGLVVEAGQVDRHDLPVEVDLSLSPLLSAGALRAFAVLPDGTRPEIPAQLDPSDAPGRTRLTAIIPGRLPKLSQAKLLVYFGSPAPEKPVPAAVSTRDGADGMKWLENDQVRLLLGPEGAHIYRWELKQAGDRDMTMPGERGWAGFSDITGPQRAASYQLACTARGPALVRYTCTGAEKLVKTVSLYAGASWVEVVLSEPVETYWDFDNPRNFAADGPTPGTCLFSNGATAPVGRPADGVESQRRGNGASWAVKSSADRLALGLVTPDATVAFRVGPGGGMGGVGIERSVPVGHFVTFCGLLNAEPRAAMQQLHQTLSFRNRPRITAFAVQKR